MWWHPQCVLPRAQLKCCHIVLLTFLCTQCLLLASNKYTFISFNSLSMLCGLEGGDSFFVTTTKCAVTSQLGIVTCVVELPCWCGLCPGNKA